MPRSKKKKPGNERTKKFVTVFCVSELVIFLLVWIFKEFFQATIGELLLFYFIATLSLIIALRAIDRRAADNALYILSRQV